MVHEPGGSGQDANPLNTGFQAPEVETLASIGGRPRDDILDPHRQRRFEEYRHRQQDLQQNLNEQRNEGEPGGMEQLIGSLTQVLRQALEPNRGQQRGEEVQEEGLNFDERAMRKITPFKGNEGDGDATYRSFMRTALATWKAHKPSERPKVMAYILNFCIGSPAADGLKTEYASWDLLAKDLEIFTGADKLGVVKARLASISQDGGDVKSFIQKLVGWKRDCEMAYEREQGLAMPPYMQEMYFDQMFEALRDRSEGHYRVLWMTNPRVKTWAGAMALLREAVIPREKRTEELMVFDDRRTQSGWRGRESRYDAYEQNKAANSRFTSPGGGQYWREGAQKEDTSPRFVSPGGRQYKREKDDRKAFAGSRAGWDQQKDMQAQMMEMLQQILHALKPKVGDRPRGKSPESQDRKSTMRKVTFAESDGAFTMDTVANRDPKQEGRPKCEMDPPLDYSSGEDSYSQ